MLQYETSGLTRREALALGLGAVGAVALGGKSARAASPQSANTTMKLGCSTVNFRTRPLREALERIQRAGFKYIETHATGPFCPHVNLEKDDPQGFRQLVREYGFKGVTGMWAPQGAIMSNPKSVEGKLLGQFDGPEKRVFPSSMQATDRNRKP